MSYIKVITYGCELTGNALQGEQVNHGEDSTNNGTDHSDHGGRLQGIIFIHHANDYHKGARTQNEGATINSQNPSNTIPRRSRRHHIRMSHHENQRQGHHDAGDCHPASHFPIGFASLNEKDNHDNHQYHNGNQFLSNARGDMTEAIKDTLPVLQVHEYGNAADNQ